VTANSGSAGDIQAAVDEVVAAGGGTVYIPAGDWDFGEATVDVPAGVNIFGGQVTGSPGQGTGVWDTIMRLPPDSGSSRHMFYIDGTGSDEPIRFSHVSLIGRTGAATATGDTGININNVKNYRVDHCRFQKMGSNGVRIWNSGGDSEQCQGVVDHCEFWDMYKYDAEQAGVGYGYGVCPARYWTDEDFMWYDDIDVYLGKYNNTIFVEDCFFDECRHAVASSAGAHYVFRHNIVQYPHSFTPQYPFHQVDAHGTYYPAPYVGTRCFEVYNNTIKDPQGISYGEGGIYSKGAGIRGGGGVIFGNTFEDIELCIGLSNDGGNPDNLKCRTHDVWIWGNDVVGYTMYFFAKSENVLPITENEHYFLYEKSGYTPYPYPHPLTLEAYP
ncbi:hypothetical protein KAU87_02815, partial [Candidatus Bathyarchaeota archaeon]|nr:hypothetical protein [Candidatus Bathyarchaeota archaeon]